MKKKYLVLAENIQDNDCMEYYETSQKYSCVSISPTQAKYIKKGDLLLVVTNSGSLNIMKAESGAITGKGAYDLETHINNYFPLHRVVSFVNRDLMDYFNYTLINELKKLDSVSVEVIRAVNNYFDEDLPF